MSKAPSMFTIKGWIQLPFAILIRTPFILIKGLVYLFKKLDTVNERILRALPAPDQNPAYKDFYEAKALEEIQRRFTRG